MQFWCNFIVVEGCDGYIWRYWVALKKPGHRCTRDGVDEGVVDLGGCLALGDGHHGGSEWPFRTPWLFYFEVAALAQNKSAPDFLK